MTTGDASPSEPSGPRSRGQSGQSGQPGQDGPGDSSDAGLPPAGGWPQPGAQDPPPGYPPPAPGYPPPGYPPPGYQPGAQHPGAATGQVPLSPQEERNWAMAAHFSALIGMVIGLSFVGPLVVLLAQGSRSPYVRANAVEALNFNLSVLIYFIVSIVLSLILIGFLLMFAVFVAWLVFTIIAGVKTSNGEAYRYPLTIRMVS